MLREVFLDGLKLLHPYMPFVTEALWGYLQAGRGEPDLIVAPWPRAGAPDKARARVADHVSALQAAIGAIRRVRSDFKIDSGSAGCRPRSCRGRRRQSWHPKPRLSGAWRGSQSWKSPVPVPAAGPESGAIMRRHDRRCALVAAAGIQVFLPLEELLDLDAERARAADRALDLDGRERRLQAMLANPGFVGNAPAAVVERRRAELATISADLENVKQFIAELDA